MAFKRVAKAKAGVSTRAVHSGEWHDEATGAVGTPIYQTATFEYPNVATVEGEPTGRESPYIYTRNANPTVEAFARKVAALEGAEDAVATASGMGAISCSILALADPGATILTSPDLYGMTWSLLETGLKPLGYKVRHEEHERLADAAGALREGDLVHLEAPTNPFLRVPPIDAVTAVTKDAGVAVTLDATFASPVNLAGLAHGVDVSIHSASKYLGGHSDLIGGVASGSKETIEKVRKKMVQMGAPMDPHQAYLALRGTKTLALRVERQNASAIHLARWLEEQPKVKRVWNPGLASHPDHSVAKRLLAGYGGMVTFDLGSEAASRGFRDALRLVRVCPSLGGVESMMSRPFETSHRWLPPKEREKMGITEGLIRLSVGIEDLPDLKADVAQALERS